MATARGGAGRGLAALRAARCGLCGAAFVAAPRDFGASTVTAGSACPASAPALDCCAIDGVTESRPSSMAPSADALSNR
jgi:hypothetical protein